MQKKFSLLFMVSISAMFLLACGSKAPDAAATRKAPGVAKERSVAPGVSKKSSLDNRKLPLIAQATTALVMRKKPGASAPKAVCTLYGPSEVGILKKNISTLPAKMTVTVLSRGAKKVQVGKWNNYWYKIKTKDISDDMTNSCEDANGPLTVWVFGEFLKYSGAVDD